jgi:hypothetical protein
MVRSSPHRTSVAYLAMNPEDAPVNAVQQMCSDKDAQIGAAGAWRV